MSPKYRLTSTSAALFLLFSVARGAVAAEAPLVDLALWGGIKTTAMRDLKHETDLVTADMKAHGMDVVTSGTGGLGTGLEAGWRLPAHLSVCLRGGWLGRDGGDITGTLSDAYGTADVYEHVTINGWCVEGGGRYERLVAPRLSLRGGLFAGLVRATADIRLRSKVTGLYALLLGSGDHTVPYRASGLVAEALVGVAYAITPRCCAGLDAGWRLGKTGPLKATAAGDTDNDGAIDAVAGDPRRSSDGTKDLTLDFSGLVATLFITLAL
ncbi:MAG: hypothetical protein AAB152_00465 [Candidatus Coatesbacteria bacterium]